LLSFPQYQALAERRQILWGGKPRERVNRWFYLRRGAKSSTVHARLAGSPEHRQCAVADTPAGAIMTQYS